MVGHRRKPLQGGPPGPQPTASSAYAKRGSEEQVQADPRGPGGPPYQMRVFIIFGGPQGHEDRPVACRRPPRPPCSIAAESSRRAGSPPQRKALPHGAVSDIEAKPLPSKQ